MAPSPTCWYEQRPIKRCTRVQAHRPHTTYGLMFSWRIRQKVPARAHLCWHHRQKSLMVLKAKVRRHLLRHTKMYKCRFDTCFIGHWRCRVRWWHWFLHLAQIEVNVRPKKVRFPNTTFSPQNISIVHLVQFILRIPRNGIDFIVRKLEMPSIAFQKMPKVWPDLTPKLLSSGQIPHCEMCWRYGIN